MGSQYMGYPSPRGVHVSETQAYASDGHDPYQPPRRNRYSRSSHQTPRIRDVTWASFSEPTPQTPHAPPMSWLPPPQAPSSPAYRPPPSPAPTVGEHMAVDDFAFTQDDFPDPYRPRRQRGGKGLLKSLWNGLKKLSGHNYTPYISRSASYESQMEEVSAPRLSGPSEGIQYVVDPTPPETDEQDGATPYTSPYARPTNFGGSIVPGSLRGSPVPSMEMPQHTSARGSPMPVLTPYVRPTNLGNSVPPGSLRGSPVPSMEMPQHTSARGSPMPAPTPYARPTNLDATPAIVPSSLRRSPVPVPSIEVPPITVVSPSIPPSPRPSPVRSTRAASAGISRNLSVGGPEPIIAIVPSPPVEDGSQTLHEPVYPAPFLPLLNTQLTSAPVRVVDDPRSRAAPKGLAFEEPSSPSGSLASTIARFRRFLVDLDELPWMSDAQIADEYVPEQNPRSRMRRRIRQGTEPSWYNPRPEVVERPAYLSEWDMWAVQSTAALWNRREAQAPGREWGVMYPHGYAGVVPGVGVVS